MNPYEVLGVSPDATQDEIAKAYRAKSRKLHPDAGGDAAAFAELSHAYEILSDEAKRAHYDRTGGNGPSLSEVETTVAALVIQAFEYPNANPIRWICDKVDRQRDTHKRQKETNTQKLATMRRLVDRFEASNKDCENVASRDFIAGCLAGHIQTMEAAIVNDDHAIELGTAVLTFLNGIKWNGSQSFSVRELLHCDARGLVAGGVIR